MLLKNSEQMDFEMKDELRRVFLASVKRGLGDL